MIGGQRIQVGMPHAGKIAEVTVEADTYLITVDPGITITAPRNGSRDIKRQKASNYQPGYYSAQDSSGINRIACAGDHLDQRRVRRGQDDAGGETAPAASGRGGV
jgi:hypothetical protein